MVSLWLSGYDGYSQTPWIRVTQLPALLFSPFSSSRLISNDTFIMFAVLFCLYLRTCTYTYVRMYCTYCTQVDMIKLGEVPL